MAKNVIIGQSGGPTAVINSSLAGVDTAARSLGADTVDGMKRRLPALKRLTDYHLLLIVLFENTEINRVVTEQALSIRDIYFKALAGSFITEKRRIAHELRSAGIYTILTEPEKLTATVIDGYLEMKERGLV